MHYQEVRIDLDPADELKYGEKHAKDIPVRECLTELNKLCLFA